MRLLIAVDRKERGVEIIRKTMRYQIQLNAKELKNVAGAFKGISDPYATVVLASTDEELGRTVSVKNCLNPSWAESIYYEYPENEENDNVHVEVHISDDNRGKSKDRLMVKTMVNLKDALNSPEQGLDIKLDDGGTLKFRVVPSTSSIQNIRLQFRALDVKNIEKGALGLGRTDPYIEISKKYSYPSEGTFHQQVVYRSEIIDNHLNPFWEETCLDLESFCDGNLDMPLRISLWDYGSRKRTIVGLVETTARGLLESVAQDGNGDRSKSLEFRKASNDDDALSSNRKVGDLVVLGAKLEDS